MHRPARWLVATILTVIAFVLVGCSGDDMDQAARAPDVGTENVDTLAGTGEDRDAGAEEGEADGGTDVAGSSEDHGDVLAVGAALGRMVIRTADLELEVADTATAVERATAIAERAGGFVSRADLTRADGDQLRGSLTLRVPTERLGTALSELEGLATQVLSKQLGSEDVTEEYSDIQAQLRNLRALETELLDLLAEIRQQSDSADEILRVFERIRQVREEIEVLQGRQQVLDDLVDLATIDLRLVPASESIPLADEGWSPGTAARDALRTTVAALQGVADAAIWIVLTALPVLLVLAIPVAAVTYAARRWRHRPVARSD